MTTPTKAYAATTPTAPLGPLGIERRDPLPTDVEIDIMYCGVCHSDIHTARDEWGGAAYPVVPGHEIVGRVMRVGAKVTRFRVGDLAAVGCMVDSCHACDQCGKGLEQFCATGATFTYNSPDPHTGRMTYGGYSERIVCDESFTLRVPATLDPARAAPLLCAGITTWSPLRKWGAGPGRKVGIVGLGGLGHMGVKFARAMGAHVVLFTTSPGKIADGKRLGAHEVVVSHDADAMAKQVGSFDMILDTVSADHSLDAYMQLLKVDGSLVLVGVPPKPQQISAFSLIIPRRNLSGSLIGGVAETQEMLDWCGTHGVECDIELIRMDQINEAWDRVMKADVKYRFVIDMASLRS
jgi:uncharacterized zinc-type alcohol dehydrogenase-like protein